MIDRNIVDIKEMLFTTDWIICNDPRSESVLNFNTNELSIETFKNEYHPAYFPPGKAEIPYKDLVTALVNLHLKLIDFQELLFQKLGFKNMIDGTRKPSLSAKKK